MYCKTYSGVNYAIIHLGRVSQANDRTTMSLNLPCASNESHNNHGFGETLAL
jgi:hypothetical protein